MIFSVSSIFTRMAALSAASRPHAVATVVRTQGSTPQIVGARLVVTDDEHERPAGTLGGGCVEADAILASREILRQGGRSLRSYSLTEDLAWNTGLVCGGTMWILAESGEEALSAGGKSLVDECARAADGGPPLAIVTLLERRGQNVSFVARLAVDAGGAVTGSLGDPSRDAMAAAEALKQLPHGTARTISLGEAQDLLIEPIAGRPQIVIAGGGHVAQAIARQAQLLDFDVTILEDRPEFAQSERFGGARVLAGDIAETIASLDYGWNSHIVIATRGHKLDADCLLAAVKTPVRYIGLLGSRRKAALVAGCCAMKACLRRASNHPHARRSGTRRPDASRDRASVMAQITKEKYRVSGTPGSSGSS
jgi:xanthine dehydrogenase accessory factor